MVDAFLQQIELRHLQTFLAVVEEMSFSRAAERLGIAQPPLSRQIQRLETTLDVKLFERTRPRITLTSAGEVFVKGARSVLQQVEQSVQMTQLASQGRAGQLIVGLDSSAPACDQVLQKIQTYRTQYPNIDIQIQEMGAETQLTALENGEIAVGFMVPQVIPEHLSMDIVTEEPLVAVLPTEHPLARHESVLLSDLENESFIMDTRWSEGLGGLGERLLQKELFHSKVVQSASDSRLILSCVASELGVSILPVSICRASPHPGVAYRPIFPGTMIASLAVVWPRKSDRSALTTFLKHLHKNLDALGNGRSSRHVTG